MYKFTTLQLVHKLKIQFALYSRVFFSECSSFKEMRIYEHPSYLLGEVWWVLTLSRILYFIQIWHWYCILYDLILYMILYCTTWKCHVYTIKFGIICHLISSQRISQNVIRDKKFLHGRLFYLLFQALHVTSWNRRSLWDFPCQRFYFLK